MQKNSHFFLVEVQIGEDFFKRQFVSIYQNIYNLVLGMLTCMHKGVYINMYKATHCSIVCDREELGTNINNL